jgi:hypothetical protein
MNTIIRTNINNNNTNTLSNNRIENRSNIDHSVFRIIDTLLISVDAYNLLFNNNSTNEFYYLIQFNSNFDFNDLVNLIKSLLYQEIYFFSTSPCQNYYLINFKKNEEIILVLHIYNMSTYNYCTKFTEPYFDCNLIYRNYHGYNIMYNYHCSNSISYEDVVRRLYNKKFSYISDNLKNIDEYLKTFNKSLVSITNSEILNKLTYAIRLIQNGWIMDEYILNNKTWTMNYWKNYKDYINIIKLNNNNNLCSKCNICKKEFIDQDIVFNKNNLFINYDCLFDILTNI